MNTRILFLLSLLFFVNSASFSQEGEDVRLFVGDMLTLAGNFAQPAADGAAYQASAGWFSSAAALEKWDVRLSMHGNALFVPEDRKQFSLSNSMLELLQIEGADAVRLPTAFGSGTDVYFAGDITFINPVNGEQETASVRFKGLDGISLDYVPHAFLQGAVGLPYESELTIRGMPEVTLDGVTASTFGIGLKHSLNQYFRFNDPEGFRLALALAYSDFNVEYGFEAIEVDDLLSMDVVNVDADLWMAEAIGSKRWGSFELFAALGATNSRFNYEMGGGGPALGVVNAELLALGDAVTQFKADLGMNVFFGPFRISAMATGGDFFNANLGIHIHI